MERVKSWLEPDESLLKYLGVSRKTFVDTGLGLNRFCGICKSNRFQRLLFFFQNNFVVFAMFGFIVGAVIEWEIDDILEGIQNILIIFNIYAGPAAYFYYQEEYLGVYRSIRDSPFDYKGTLDEATKEDIKEMRTEVVSAQKRFRKLLYINLGMVTLAQCGKKVIGYLIRGGGRKAVDGVNGLIRNTPFGIYIPFAEYWPPYVLGIIFSNQFIVYLCLSVVAYCSTFQMLISDLIVEYSIVGTTFRRAVERAEVLYQRKYTNSTDGKNITLWNDCLKRCLNLSVKHHQQTDRFCCVLKDIMSLPLFLIFVSWALIVCISFYLIINGEGDVELLLPLPALIACECAVAFTFCYYGERLKIATQTIGTSIIEGAEATKHLVVMKPYMSMMLSHSSVPFTLFAAGFSTVDHELFMSLITTAYSYMGFLLSGKED